jgi:hypothetical protein
LERSSDDAAEGSAAEFSWSWSWTAGGLEVWAPVQPLEARQVVQEPNSTLSLWDVKLRFPAGHFDLKFEDHDDGVSRYGPDVLYGMGYRGSASPRVQSYHVIRGGHHVLGAIKTANSSGPGNVELRGWREKGNHQQGGEYARQTPTTPPCGKTARDRCALNSMEPSYLIEFSLKSADAEDSST